ncbi:hypothetical protein ASG01_08915 [Chryseobacterium sp. Leaf180]|uniref:hypothetical protein n=1 Tax=Chryseobacterium sp. Leaf180 TaxID=1736289 RepID=UPI0006F78CA3|nr:hypothetical protein [Chryseobacterium sp. Leaf180]KQR93308.1 hypothetical protein ASG01_08915 [Chryseobacterium sp. Leaf180]
MITENDSWVEITDQSQRYPDCDVWICNLKANKAVFYHYAFDKIPNRYTHLKIAVKPKAPEVFLIK